MNKRRSRALGVTGALFLLGLVGLFWIFGFPRVSEKHNYPLPDEYRDLILTTSAEYSVDPDLVAAMICCESSFRPEAVSRVGAVGLMQIMPETGEWIAGKLGIDYSESILLDPATNVKMGCWYLKFLIDRFESDDVAVLAAYNAGHGNVAKWLKDASLSDGDGLHTIPNTEPRQYVTKVKKAYEAYKRIYNLSAA